jgi:ribonuclease HI
MNKNIRIPKIIPNTFKYILNFDGCSKGNPGHSGGGAVIYKDNKELYTEYKYLGNYKTNNQAEYGALIIGLQRARILDIRSLLVLGDSEIVINQMNKKSQVKSPKLILLNKEASEITCHFEHILFMHIYREQNKRADELSNLGISALFNCEKSKNK